MSSPENQRRALINMGMFGAEGPYPESGTAFDTVGELRHLAGLFPLEALTTATPAGITDDGDIFMDYDPFLGGLIFTLTNDLKRDKGLHTAVLISLLTDKVARDTDILPDNTGIRRGWWANNDLGSRLWLLFRSSLKTDTPSKIEEFSQECLQWMLDEGVARKIIVTAERTDVYRIDWLIQIIKPGDVNSTNFKFFFNWEAEIFGEVS